MDCPGRRQRGFTLIELLVVVAITALVMSLLFFVGRWIREGARNVGCLQNQRSLVTAFFAYSADNLGRFAGTDTGIHKHDWVQSTNCLDLHGLEKDTGVTTGTLWAYVADKRAYKSPYDPFTPAQRIRSYSFSGFLADSAGDQWAGPPDALVSGYSRIRRPADMIATVVEYDHRGYNINSWGVMGNGSYIWVDKLCNWNPRHFNFAFVDGHVDAYRFVSPQEDVDYYFTLAANNIYFETPDYDWITLHLFPGIDW
ncbi:MAG: prepilin-type N-terminal cleavage/methylation domain-containing protein [Phycisphaerae bacterium]|jgi:prepilin-type N-terminal cleavage/methylation domain-containing protein/prepilin-type processing-associated H-X9-DG protein|nr:prepilin-type N-terminal cleavage/methylation domain-containing protein [Phycisphaerae bacterium]